MGFLFLKTCILTCSENGYKLSGMSREVNHVCLVLLLLISHKGTVCRGPTHATFPSLISVWLREEEEEHLVTFSLFLGVLYASCFRNWT